MKPRAMARVATRLVIWLAYGAAIAVGVAWGIAAFGPLRASRQEMFVHDSHAVQAVECSGQGWVRRYWTSVASDADAPVLAVFLDFVDFPPPPPIPAERSLDVSGWGDLPLILQQSQPSIRSGLEHAAGWPVLALWFVEHGADDALTVGVTVKGGIPVSQDSWASKIRALPLLPIWHGLLIDSAFWGVIAFSTTSGVRSIRRAVRRRRGQCPTCRYDLGAASGTVCPECGTSVAPKRTPPT